MYTYNIYLLQRFKNEDERYKQGKYILGESTDVSQQAAAFKCHYQRSDNRQPYSNPEMERQKFNSKAAANLMKKQ